jgi:peptidoglycan/xylan/chitin deacetylase (PgdA/CDA1 family)
VSAAISSRYPPASISVDLDSAGIHLAGYGLSVAAQDGLLQVAVPRLLSILAELGCTATLFAVAGALPERRLLEEAVTAGHEIASHSRSHPMPFSMLPIAKLRQEVATARDVIEQSIGVRVVGFRAPNWDVTRRVWNLLAESSFGYDASLLPTPFHTLIRLRLAMSARSLRPLREMPPLPAGTARLPHRIVTSAGMLWEFPIPVTPRLRLPVYHTIRYAVPAGIVDRAIDAASRRGEPFGYAIHAIDLVALSDPGIDARLARHPGMHEPLVDKLARVEAALRLVASRFRVIPYRRLLDELNARKLPT